jgi:LPS sulfotransferase NodH
MSHNHRAALDEELRAHLPGYNRFDDLLPNHRWIRLTRRDKVSQAIYYCRAETSSQWASTMPPASEHLTPAYDFFHILSRMVMLQIGEMAWEVYFEENSIDPLLVVYEDFFQDIEAQLRRLTDYLGGLPPEHNYLDTGSALEIQRDKESEALRKRFISDLGRLGETSFARELGQPLEKWSRFFFERHWLADATDNQPAKRALQQSA